MYELDTGIKWLTAKNLADLLLQLPPDAKVQVNTVGNLLVTLNDEKFAYIDFNEGAVESMI